MAATTPQKRNPETVVDTDNTYAFVEETVKKHGLGSALYGQMKEERDKWRKEVINIAVIGQARQGKSSFINANIGQKLAAVRATGVCTTDIRSFPHPRNPNIELWDVPGIDAVQFPRRDYFKKIGYYENDYDFFLIVTKDIFSSDAKYIADEVQKLNKRFYLIRTHIDDTIQKQLEDLDDDKLDKNDIVAEVRRNIETELQSFSCDASKIKVYLVNNRNVLEYDFPQLLEDICQDCVSELQQEAMLLTIGGYGREMVELKYKLFKKRVKKAALASAVGGAVPIPGFSILVDLTILIEEILTYFEGFGLSKASIESLEDLNNVRKGTIERALKAKLRKEKNGLLYMIREGAPKSLSNWISIRRSAISIASSSGRMILSKLSLLVASSAIETTFKWVLPVVGYAAAAALSFAVTLYQLSYFLGQMKETALFANSYISNSLSQPFEIVEDNDEDNTDQTESRTRALTFCRTI